MAQVVWTAEARRWLQEIYDDISKDSEEAAYRTVVAIHQRAEVLATFPESGLMSGFELELFTNALAGRPSDQQEVRRA